MVRSAPSFCTNTIRKLRRVRSSSPNGLRNGRGAEDRWHKIKSQTSGKGRPILHQSRPCLPQYGELPSGNVLPNRASRLSGSSVPPPRRPRMSRPGVFHIIPTEHLSAPSLGRRPCLCACDMMMTTAAGAGPGQIITILHLPQHLPAGDRENSASGTGADKTRRPRGDAIRGGAPGTYVVSSRRLRTARAGSSRAAPPRPFARTAGGARGDRSLRPKGDQMHLSAPPSTRATRATCNPPRRSQTRSACAGRSAPIAAGAWSMSSPMRP